MSESSDVELLHRTWQALAEGDLGVMQAALAPDAKWRAIEDGPWNCESREAIIEVMGRNLEAGLRGRIEETLQDGERILVAFRPERPFGGERPLDDGIVYVVVTMREGQIIEMKGCADRAAAIAYINTGPTRTASTTPTAQGSR